MGLLPDTSLRVREPELLDDPALDHQAQRRALRGLERINAVSRVSGAIWDELAHLVGRSDRPVRVLDVATGAGDVPIGLWRRAKAAGNPVEIVGCDKSHEILIYARDRTRQQRAEIQYFEHDVLTHDLPRDFDVITCNQFLHHLSDQDVLGLLAKLADAARRMVIISDLERSGWGYALTTAACLVFTRCRVLRHDGPASVRAAFTSDEALALARRAGLDGVVVSRRFPSMWLMVWSKP